MKKRMKLFLLMALLLLPMMPLGAQQMKRVTGHILDKTTGKPIDLKQVAVMVYGFNTVAQAEDVKKQMDGEVWMRRENSLCGNMEDCSLRGGLFPSPDSFGTDSRDKWCRPS